MEMEKKNGKIQSNMKISIVNMCYKFVFKCFQNFSSKRGCLLPGQKSLRTPYPDVCDSFCNSFAVQFEVFSQLLVFLASVH